MGSIMSAIYDDIDDYETLCKYLKVKEVSTTSLSDMYKHAKELIKNLTPAQEDHLKNGYLYAKFK